MTDYRTNVFPFTAIVRQEEMKLALLLNALNPRIGGVLIRGHRGTAKSTAARALARVLPEIKVVDGCPFNCDPDDAGQLCPLCAERSASGGTLPAARRRTNVVTLPLGASEDRVLGTIDIEKAIKKGEKRFEPGVLAAAHRGILYVDEVNLLDDHIVDILLDAAAMGVNTVEREGISFRHPTRFSLIGTMNPEEGELRPQLLDRFGLCVNIEGISSPEARVAIMERRSAFDEDAPNFVAQWEEQSQVLVEKISTAIALYPQVSIARELLFEIAGYCLDVGVDGHRGDIIILKAAKTLAAYHGRTQVVKADIEVAAELALPHRIRRQPLQDIVVDVEQLRRLKQVKQGAGG